MHKSTEGKLEYLKTYQSDLYVAYLRSMNKEKKLQRLYDGTVSWCVSWSNTVWYIHIELIPKLNKMKKDNKLKPNCEKTIEIDG